MNIVINLLLLVISICLQHTSFAKVITFDKEQEYALKSNSKFIASAGWKFDDETSKFIAPEGDLSVYFIEKPFTDSIEDMTLQAWKSVKPDFEFKVLQKISVPAEDAWDQQHTIVYDVPAKDNRVIAATINVFNNIAYINLFDGSTDGFSRRGAQLSIALRSWKPNERKFNSEVPQGDQN